MQRVLHIKKTLLITAAICSIPFASLAAGDVSTFFDETQNIPVALPIKDIGAELPSLSGSFLAGQVAIANGDNEDAIAQFRRAILLDPENVNLKQSLFVSLTSNGQIADAMELLKSIPVENQNQNINHLLVAVNAIKQKSWTQAVQRVDKIVGADLDTMLTKILGSWALYGNRDFEGAIARMGEVNGPDWTMMIKEYHIGLLQAANGDNTKAIDALEKAISYRSVAGALTETYMRAVEALVRAQSMSGDNDKALLITNDGLALLPNHKPLEALKAKLENGEAITPMFTTAAQGAAEIFFNVGTAISRQGGLPFAQSHLQLSHFLDPANDETLYALGTVYQGQKKYPEANKYFGLVPETSAIYSRSKLEIGLNLDRIEQTPEAIKTLEALNLANPDDGLITLSLGALYASHMMFAEAATLYDTAIVRLDPNVEKNWIYFYRRGIAHERLKQWPKAEADFKKALELSPEQSDVLNYLGYSWVDMGINLDEGVALIEKASELRPNSGFIIDSLGWAFYKLERYPEAVEQLEVALDLMKSDPVVNDHLGDAYWKVDRKLEAVFRWKHALSLKPTDEDKAKITQKLLNGLTN